MRSDKGTVTLDESTLNADSPFSALLNAVAAALDLSSTRNPQVTIKTGFPPRTISGDNQLSLAHYGIRDGDQIIVNAAVPTTETMSGSIATTQQRLQTHSDQAHNEDAIPLAAPGQSPGEAGYLVRREIADDNNCLFESIRYVLDKQRTVSQLRQLVVDEIRKNSDKYNEVVLDRPVSEYCSWILKNGSWGGAIELSIFSKQYGTEICSIDAQTTRIDRFGEGLYSQRACIVYSGIHYDALAVMPAENTPNDFDTTMFNSKDEYILTAAKQLATVLNKRHMYTDVANFTLRCDVCKSGIVGQKDAYAHAKATGHSNFVEYVR